MQNQKTISELKNETFKLVNEIFPEVSESQLELDEQLFSRNEMLAETTQSGKLLRLPESVCCLPPVNISAD